MSDERTEVRALLEAVSADLPPTRLTVDGICAAGRRSRFRPHRPSFRLSVPLPSRHLIMQVAAVVVVLAVPGLIVFALVRGSQVDNVSSAGGGTGSDTGASAASGGQLDRSKLARVTYVPPGYRANGGCRPRKATTVPQCTYQYSIASADGGRVGLSVTQYQGARPLLAGAGADMRWETQSVLHVHGVAANLRLGREPGTPAGQVRYTREVTWTEHGETIVVSSGPADSEARLLSADELLRIASGVRW